MKTIIKFKVTPLIICVFMLNIVSFCDSVNDENLFAEIVLPVSSSDENPVIEIFDPQFAVLIKNVMNKSETKWTRNKERNGEGETAWELRDSKLGFVVTILDGDDEFKVKKVVVVGNSYVLDEDADTVSRKIPPDRGLEAYIFTLAIQAGIFRVN